MPDGSYPYKLNLAPQTLKALHLDLCDKVSAAVRDNESRNNDLQIWRDQLEGNGVTAQNKQWANACNFIDPISMEAFLTILSQLTGASNRDPKVAVEAFAKEDEENAAVIESWLVKAGSECDIESCVYNFSYNAARDPAVVGYVGWKQRTRIHREVGYRKPGEAQVYSDYELDDSADPESSYEEVPVAEEVTEEGFDIRAVELSDFFLYPANSSSIERATTVAERMYLTAEELRDGIEDYGYDREAVEDLLKLGAQEEDEDRQDMAERDGTELASGNDGFYPVYTVYTRLPQEVGDGHRIPSRLRQDDFLVVLNIERSIILKMDFSPFTERPYFSGGILPKPNKMLGHSLMSILEPMQDEANANIQATIDGMNMTATPCLLIPKSEAADMNRYKVYPGALIPTDDPKSVVPLDWNRAPFRDGIAWQQDLRNRSNAVVSAQGLGQLQPKVRKQSEIEGVQNAAASKFGMLLQNFQRTVISEIFRRMVSLKTHFGEVDEEGEEFVGDDGKSLTLTPQALRGKYRVVASGTSLSHSPETREAISRRKQEIQIGYLQAKQGMAQDVESVKLIWHGARELLIDLGERNPEAWIGEEPQQAPQPPQNAPQGQPGASPQGAQPLNPQANGNGNGANPLAALSGGGQ